jgi:MoxR-like ATPase
MNSSLQSAAHQLRQTVQTATQYLVGRQQLAELMLLGAVAQEHLLIIGPPGTGKSAVARQVAQALGGRYFEYLLGRFTEPSELFGPTDLRKLREGTVETDVTGMLPQADVVFLDEVFLGSTAILNTLLGVLNERRFRRGHTQLHCPLRVCVGAANALPEDDALHAFADRFLLHAFIEPVPDHELENMLTTGWAGNTHPVTTTGGLRHLDVLAPCVPQVDLAGSHSALAHAIRQLRQAGILLSDRRIVKTQRLIAASAVLAGRMSSSEADLWPLFYVLPTHQSQSSAREVLQELFANAAHPHLFHAVENATLQPASRAARLLAAAQAVLSQPADQRAPAQLESVLREIDANFDEASLPQDLALFRAQLIHNLS